MGNEEGVAKLRRDAAKARSLAAMAYNSELRERLNDAADALDNEAVNSERKIAEWARTMGK